MRDNLPDLVTEMNKIAKQSDGPQLDFNGVKKEIDTRDMQLENKYTKDHQIMLINNARAYWPEKISRVAVPQAPGSIVRTSDCSSENEPPY